LDRALVCFSGETPDTETGLLTVLTQDRRRTSLPVVAFY
jgi:hypothetical protein